MIHFGAIYGLSGRQQHSLRFDTLGHTMNHDDGLFSHVLNPRLGFAYRERSYTFENVANVTAEQMHTIVCMYVFQSI